MEMPRSHNVNISTESLARTQSLRKQLLGAEMAEQRGKEGHAEAAHGVPAARRREAARAAMLH